MANILESVIQVVCEWDIGQDGQVFADQSTAEAWVIQALADGGIDDPLEELESLGLVAYDEIQVVWGSF